VLNPLNPIVTPNSFALPPLLGQALGSAVTSSPVIVTGMTGAATPISIVGGLYSLNGGDFTSDTGIIKSGDNLVVQVQASGSYGGLATATITVGTYTTNFTVVAQNDPSATSVTAGIAGGDSHSVILRPDGGVLTLGYDGDGELGDGGNLSRSTPGLVAGVATVTKIAVGKFHTLAVRNDGSLLAWGWNAAGQLGDGSAEARNIAIKVNITNVASVAAGWAHTLALKNDGTVWAWGLNIDGQLGDGLGGTNGTKSYSFTPVQVLGLSGIVAIAAGERSSYAIDMHGNIIAWGDNTYGQLGIGTSAKQAISPTTVQLSGVVQIVAGSRHAMALRTDGSLWSWGDNNNGQLGDGTRNGRNMPSTVPGLLKGVTGIAVGDKHSLAIVNGSLYAWGWNQYGQLGEGTTSDQLSPVVVPNTVGISNVAAGARHSIALYSNNNTIQLWGDNYYGQLGNRSGNYNPLALAEEQLNGDGQVVLVTSSDGGSSGQVDGKNNLPVNSDVDYINFGVVNVNVANRIPVIISNRNLTSWTNFIVQVSGNDYNQENNCPSTLEAGSSCTVTASFNPTIAAQAYGNITIHGNRGSGPETFKTLSLSGIGNPASVLSSQTISFTAPATATYGDAAITLSASVSSSLTPTFTLVSGPAILSGSTLSITGAGNIVVKASQGGNTNYAAATDVQQTIAVSPKALTITANNASRVYGAANPTSPGFTAPALVGNDTLSGVTYSYASGATSSAGVGNSYTITPSVAVFSLGNAANYTISYLAGTLTISNPVLATYTVSTNAGANGIISPTSQSVTQGIATSFTLTPVTGYAASATGCSGSLNGNTFTTGIITADCTVSATFTQTVNLAAGWNLLGNSVDAPLDVTAILNDTTKVTTVWKWIPSSSKWAFYTPSMIANDLANYAAGKGYDVLTTINTGEGFWVNAKAVWSIQLPLGTAISSSLFADQQSLNNKLPKGWSLIAVGDNPTPRTFANTIALTQPVSPDIAATSLTTLWSWDNGLSSWYFYAPSLDNSGALTSYITSKGYFNFSTNSKTLDPTMGFWVNHP
jgi:alpha-tubulin suppressor-like RCC1 family protein